MFFFTVKYNEIGFEFNQTLDYLDNIYVLLSKMKAGQQILIAGLTGKPSEFIAAVKELISIWGVKDVLFSNDFSFIQKHLSLDEEMRILDEETAQQNNKAKQRNTFYKHD